MPSGQFRGYRRVIAPVGRREARPVTRDGDSQIRPENRGSPAPIDRDRTRQDKAISAPRDGSIRTTTTPAVEIGHPDDSDSACLGCDQALPRSWTCHGFAWYGGPRSPCVPGPSLTRPVVRPPVETQYTSPHGRGDIVAVSRTRTVSAPSSALAGASKATPRRSVTTHLSQRVAITGVMLWLLLKFVALRRR